jgi:polyisoprenoid-binding protein YceI
VSLRADIPFDLRNAYLGRVIFSRICSMNRIIVSAALLLASTGYVVSAQTGGANADPKAVQAGSYGVDPSHTRVQFTVSHMGFSDWYGDFSGTTGTLSLDPANVAAAKVDISIPTASVSTTNATLDGELKSADWFDAATHPTIRFVSTKVVPAGAGKATITGNLTFHGVTKPVVLNATFNGAGVNPMNKAYTVGFNATTTIKRSDFGVKTYVPVIGDTTSLRISAAFEKKGA